MIEIVTYPQKLFDRMVKNGWYKSEDFFVSIVDTTVDRAELITYPVNINHLLVIFDDVVEDVLGRKPMTEEHAILLSNFGKKLPDSITLHIHCGAGVSRSTAVAAGIREILEERGIEIQERRLGGSYHPNPLVTKLMRDAKEKLREV